MAHNVKKKDQNKRKEARFQFKKIDTSKCLKFYQNIKMAKFCNVNKGRSILELLFWDMDWIVSNWILKEAYVALWKLETNSFWAPGSELLGSGVLVCLSVEKVSKNGQTLLKIGNLTKKLEIKDMLKVWLALNLFINLILSPW